MKISNSPDLKRALKLSDRSATGLTGKLTSNFGKVVIQLFWEFLIVVEFELKVYHTRLRLSGGMLFLQSLGVTDGLPTNLLAQQLTEAICLEFCP